jgi:hypothetical protein
MFARHVTNGSVSELVVDVEDKCKGVDVWASAVAEVQSMDAGCEAWRECREMNGRQVTGW